MPKVYRKKQALRRKRVVRRRRGYKSNNIVTRSLNPVSQNYVCKLKYATSVITDFNGQFCINLNSLYDPEQTGVGHQPYGYDQLATLYNRYRVIGASWSVVCMKQTSAICLSALPANESTPAITSGAQMRENPRAKFVYQNPGSPLKIVKGYTSIPSLIGRTKAQYMADDRFQADVNSNPQEFARLNILVNGPTDTPLNGEPLQITVEYTAEFFDLKQIGQS